MSRAHLLVQECITHLLCTHKLCEHATHVYADKKRITFPPFRCQLQGQILFPRLKVKCHVWGQIYMYIVSVGVTILCVCIFPYTGALYPQLNLILVGFTCRVIQCKLLFCVSVLCFGLKALEYPTIFSLTVQNVYAHPDDNSPN